MEFLNKVEEYIKSNRKGVNLVLLGTAFGAGIIGATGLGVAAIALYLTSLELLGAD